MRNTAAIRHKHLELDQDKLTRAKIVLGAKTETEAIERALALVVDEHELDKPLNLKTAVNVSGRRSFWGRQGRRARRWEHKFGERAGEDGS